MADPQPEQKHCGGSGEERKRLREALDDEGFLLGIVAAHEGIGNTPEDYPPSPAEVENAYQLIERFLDAVDREEESEQPHQEGEEDWPEVTIWRQKGNGENRTAWGIVNPAKGRQGGETRRYIPAPTQGEGDAICECCEKRLPLECAATDVEGVSLCGSCLSDLTAPVIKAARDVVDGPCLRVVGAGPIPELRKLLDEGYSTPEHPNQGEGSGEAWQATAVRATKLGERAANLGIKRTVERDEAWAVLERLAEECDRRAAENRRRGAEPEAGEIVKTNTAIRADVYEDVALWLRQEIASISPEPEPTGPKCELDTHESRMEVNEIEADAAEPQEGDGRDAEQQQRWEDEEVEQHRRDAERELEEQGS